MALLTVDQFAHLTEVIAFYEAAPDPSGGASTDAAKVERFFQASVRRLLQAVEASLVDRDAPPPGLSAEASGILVHALGYAAAIVLVGGNEIGRSAGDKIAQAAALRFAKGFEDALARQIGAASRNAYEAAREGGRSGGEAASPGKKAKGKAGDAERRDYAKW